MQCTANQASLALTCSSALCIYVIATGCIVGQADTYLGWLLVCCLQGGIATVGASRLLAEDGDAAAGQSPQQAAIGMLLIVASQVR